MDYEQKYREALARAKELSKTTTGANYEYIFPELKESERIRKALIKYFNAYTSYSELRDDVTAGDAIAWLEKQEPVEEIVERCKTSWFNAGKTQGKMEGLSDEEKYQQGWHDAIENQGEQKPVEWTEEDERIYQSIVQENQLDDRQTKWLSDIKYRYVPHPKQEWSKEDENEYNHNLKILNLVAEEQETKGYNNLISSVNWVKTIKDRIQSKQNNNPQGKTALEAIKEEKVDNSNKVEPKFKVGDWVVRKDGGFFDDEIKFAQITEIDGEKHWFDTGLICLKAEDMRLWTLEDAKDGDILYSEKHNLLWCYKNTKECYYCINLNYINNNISIGNEIVMPNDVRPASKELRDWQFDKMLQHTFSKINGKKELKFHEGDWIVVRGEVILICDIDNGLYEVIFANGEHRVYDANILDKEAHLWSIEDARDGDVLVASDGSIFIFAGVVDYACKYYVALTVYNGVSINKEVEFGFWELSNHVHPATKEQRDLLFEKIEDKGYEWDNEKKLLKIR